MAPKTKMLKERLKALDKESILKLGRESDGVIDFSPASDHFYKRILENINKPLEDKLNKKDNNYFFDWMYAALVAWRMNRGKNRIIEFDKFKEAIMNQYTNLKKIENCTIVNFSENDRKVLKDVFQSLHLIETRKVGKYVLTNSIIVSNSKTLHFILPNLVPPIDNAYTGKIFSLTGNVENQTKTFFQILDFYKEIINKNNITEKDLKKDGRIPQTIGKFMDEVLIAFIRKNKT